MVKRAPCNGAGWCGWAAMDGRELVMVVDEVESPGAGAKTIVLAPAPNFVKVSPPKVLAATKIELVLLHL